MPSIPASAIVQVTPGVIGAGGTALDLSGLILTGSSRIPAGTVLPFPSALAVASYFGPTSAEAAAATTYFGGFANSNKKPGQVLFGAYALSPRPAYARGGNVSALTLAQLQSITGTLSATIDGAAQTGTVNLSTATSFSAAAALVAAALTAACAFDPLSGGFVLSSATAGTASTIAFPTGTAAAALGLTQAAGAVLSQGAAPGVPAAAMAAIRAQTDDWVSFTTLWEPELADKLAFAAWTNGTQNNYLYAGWDSDITAAAAGNTASFSPLVKQAGYSGTAPVYLDLAVAVFLLGAIASLDTSERDGRATLAFRNGAGLAPSVTDATVAQNLAANGYNFYGAYATANDQFRFLYPGQVSGPFAWIDSYVNEIWMSNGFQLALMTLLTEAKSIPYNEAGYSMIRAACLDVINQAVNFGAIRPGVPLSALQAAEVNAAAGLKIDGVLSTRGWYMQVLDALPQVRAARGTPPCTFFYVDGQSVQSINLASIQVQ